jgi:hypothetical protein
VTPGLFALAIAGCGGGPPGFSGRILLADENNYSYEGHVDLASVAVAPQADATVDWSTLTTDIQGHSIDLATEVNELYLTRFADGFDEAELEGLIAEGKLLQEHIQATFLFENEGAETSVLLTAFELLGNAFYPEEYLLDDGGVWAVSLTTEGTPSARASTFVAPTDGSTNDRIVIDDASGSLDFQADLVSLEAISIPAAEVTEIDWSALTVNGLGDPVDFDRIEELLLGRYEGMTVVELESQILDLELIAAERYSVNVRGKKSIDPAIAVDDAGTAFPGFGSGEMWLVVLRCTGPTCTNPAPSFLTVVQVR